MVRGTRPRRSLTSLILLFVICFADVSATQCRAQASPHPRYRLIDLGAAPREIDDEAIALNNTGEVVFSVTRPRVVPESADTRLRVILWKNGATSDLSNPSGFPNASIHVTAINDHAQILAVLDTDHGKRPILWTDRQPRIIGFASSEKRDFTPVALDPQGRIVGTASLPYDERRDDHRRGFVWQNGVFRWLPGLPNRPDTDAGGINASGVIVGNSSPFWEDHSEKHPPSHDKRLYARMVLLGFALPLRHACIWIDGRVQDLGLPAGMAQAEASAINDDNQVAGAVTIAQDFNTDYRGILWDHGKIVHLGSLGYPPTTPVAINNKGQIVGTSCASKHWYPTIFLWQKGKIYDLHRLVRHGSNWEFRDADGINNNGEIVGVGFPPNCHGYTHYFLLIPLRRLAKRLLY